MTDILDNRKSMWILTEEYNDYNQHGEYFLTAWLEKPTENQIKEMISESYGEYSIEVITKKLLSNGGGRIKDQDHWYNLFEYN